MTYDDEYIKKQFIKNFLKEESRKIVIYGTGIRTKRLLCEITGQDSEVVAMPGALEKIAGLMDIRRTGEWIHGWKVLSEEEVQNIQEVSIVILARNAVINTIFRRIESFTRSRKIAVYDINRNDLTKRIRPQIWQYNSMEENLVRRMFLNEGYGFCSEMLKSEQQAKCFEVFLAKKKLIIRNMGILARLLIAPLVCKYMFWLVRKVLEEEIPLVLFPSRDGFLLEKIYQEIRKERLDLRLPESKYFYTSRRAVLIAGAQNREDVEFITKLPSTGEWWENVRNRFEIDVPRFDNDIISEEIVKLALERSAWERENYLKYLNHAGVICENAVLVDFVAVGTVQGALQKIIGKKLKGCYFLRRFPDTDLTEHLDVESLYGTYGDFEMDFNIYRYYYFLESVLTSDEPSFKFMDNRGNACFYSEKRSKQSLEILRVMHKNILEYCMEMLIRMPDIFSWNAPVDLYDDILGFFSKDFSDIPNTMLNELVNVDEFLDKQIEDCNR